MACVSAIFEVKISEIKSTSRQKKIAQARQSAMFLAKEYITDSLANISSHFGKTHSTLIHAWKIVKKEIEKDTLWKKQIDLAIRQLQKYSVKKPIQKKPTFYKIFLIKAALKKSRQKRLSKILESLFS